MKRIFHLIAAMVGLSLLVSACSAGGISFLATPEPSTITFAVPNQYRDYYTGKIAEFKKQNAKIEIELVSLDSSSSTPPDAAVIRWDQIYGSEGDRLAKTLDITPFLEQTKSFNRGDYFRGVLDPFTRDGKLKGLPTGVDPYVIFYNRDLFDQMGVAYPKPGWTWDDFKTTAIQLRDPIARTYGYVSTLDYVDSLFFVYQHGGNLLNGDQPQLYTPEAAEALEWYASLYTTSNVAPTQEQVRQDFGGDIRAGVMTGKVGMWFSPVSEIRGPQDQGWPFNLGVVPLPRDVTGFSVAQFEGLVIFQDTKSPQTAWQFVSFLIDQPLPWVVPARQSLAALPAYTNAMGKDQADASMAAMNDASLISTFDYRLMSGVIDVFGELTSAVIEGRATAEEALMAAQKKLTP